MPFWAYMLRCADGTYYVGHSDDIERRFAQHQTGSMRGYTSSRRPVELVWSEVFEEREQAKAAELRVKDWSRAKKEALIAGDADRLLRFSKPPSERNTAGLADARQAPSLRSGKRVWKLPPPPRAERGALSSEARSHTPGVSPPPAIVLVRPQLAENIGKAARAMLNFGLTDLRLVSPRDGWPNPDAGPAAAGADEVISGARVFDTVAEAVADRAHVFATTVRRRGVVKPVVDAAQAAHAMRSETGGSAVLFGPERAGLETDDVALARTILTVPVNPEFGSLNLAQAVILVAYEWSKGAALAQPPKTELAPPAPHDELEGLVQQIDAALDNAGFYFPPDKVQTTKRAVRSILTKPGWNTHEVRTMRGIVAALVNPRPKSS